MWLMTKYGFFSIVKKGKQIHVRARVKGDLEYLIEAISKSCLGRCYKYNVKETPKSDYRYRIIIDPMAFVNVVYVLGKDIDYSNFKDHIFASKTQRHKFIVYDRVWLLMADCYGAYGSTPKLKP